MKRPMHIARPAGQGLHCSTRARGVFVTSEDDYDAEVARGTVLCKNCVARFHARLGERGFLVVSRFEARQYPEAIWIHDDPIAGPFCAHCGNPSYVHGPGGRCLNHRIHPLLPLGDLPRPGSGFVGVQR